MNNFNLVVINKNNEAFFNFCVFFIAILYSFLLVFFIPMDGAILDRINYLNYAGNSNSLILRYMSGGVLSFLFNEPVWLMVNSLLGFFMEPEKVVSFIIFFSSFVTSFIILRVNPKYFWFLVALLFFPQVIDKFVMHLRQGLAISIFLLGWFCCERKSKIFILSITPFIHASFFFVLFLYLFSLILTRCRFAIDVKVLATCLLGIFFGLGLGYIAGFLGARQADSYQFSGGGGSGLGFLFWFGVLLIYTCQGRYFSRVNSFSILVISFYLSTYFFIEVTGRIFESMVIVVILSSLSLTSWRKMAFFIYIFLFVVFSWLLRINQPWLGWGYAG
ncbi:EpsG family protein [Pseudoalteromonas sp. BDTF-M6]|uniref:EpsG family protein n=1 Tax=Pseudoalteromonas sp. BDTF-M6 TaxID=2796132 RepID=UPI001BAFAA8C|nr:EpsG family protein [Pseudoalteromonas sp. BDTF-M6]MBS3798478.1 EpsG family protein [Pseudoalteromonas sp. BDTF-M6]